MNYLNNNFSIAKFMGLKSHGNDANDTLFEIPFDSPLIENSDIDMWAHHNDSCYLVDSLSAKYHECWDWIMPVVEKCYEYGQKDNPWRHNIVISFMGTIDIKRTYQAVVEFIMWYNLNDRQSPIEKYARKCDVTGQGMNEGICYQDGLMYFANEDIYIRWIRENQPQWADGVTDEWLLNDSYEQGMHYYTEWEDETEYLYEMVDGELVEIKQKDQ